MCSRHYRRAWLPIAIVLLGGPVFAQQSLDRFGDTLPSGAIARLGTVRFRHASWVDDFAFAPDSRTLVSIDGDGAIATWEVPSGKPVHRHFGPPRASDDIFRLFRQGPRQVAFDRDGKTVVIMAGEKPIRWQVGLKRPEVPEDRANFGPAAFRAPSAPVVPHNRLSARGKYVAIFTDYGPTSGFKADGGGGFKPAARGIVYGQPSSEIKSTLDLLDSAGKSIARFSILQKKPAANSWRSPPNGVFSGDEKLFAFCAADDTIAVYDIEARKERRFKGHQGPCTAIGFSPDGKTLISAGEFLHEWDLADGKVCRRVEVGPEYDDPNSAILFEAKFLDKPKVKTRDQISRLAFAPDGKHFAAEVNSQLVLWDAKTLKPRWSSPVAGSVFAFSPDGKYLAVLGGFRKIRLLEAASGKLVDPATDAAEIGALARFSANGKSILTEPVRRIPDLIEFDAWDSSRGEPIEPFRYPLRGLNGLTFTSDSRLVATNTTSGADNGKNVRHLKVWNAATRKLVFALPTPVMPTDSSWWGGQYALADGGNRLAVVHDEKLSVWKIGGARRTPVWSLTAKNSGFNFISAMTFSPDGKVLKVERMSPVIFGSGGRTYSPPTEVRFHDGDTGKQLSLFPNASAGEKATFDRHWHWSSFSPDSRLLATNAGASSTGLQLWNLGLDHLLHRFAEDRAVKHLAFAPDSRSLAIADDLGRISLWECATGGLRQQWQAHTGPIRGLLYSPDGRLLVSQGPEGFAIVWDLRALRVAPPWDRPTPDALWDQLTDRNARRAYYTTTSLLMDERETLALVRKRLSPAPLAGKNQVQTWIADLNSDRFPTRDKATRALRDHFEQALDALKAARRKPKSLEMARRLDQLLEAASKTSLELDRLRATRVVELLEQMGGTDAEKILRNAAKGDPQASLTRCAGEALRRIERLRE